MPNFQTWDKHPIWMHSALHQLICEAAAQEGIDSTERLNESLGIGLALRTTVRNYSLENESAVPKILQSDRPTGGKRAIAKTTHLVETLA